MLRASIAPFALDNCTVRALVEINVAHRPIDVYDEGCFARLNGRRHQQSLIFLRSCPIGDGALGCQGCIKTAVDALPIPASGCAKYPANMQSISAMRNVAPHKPGEDVHRVVDEVVELDGIVR